MKLKIDREADALYLSLDDSVVVESEEVSPGIIVDLNEQGQILGIEALYLSNQLSSTGCGQFNFPDAVRLADGMLVGM